MEVIKISIKNERLGHLSKITSALLLIHLAIFAFIFISHPASFGPLLLTGVFSFFIFFKPGLLNRTVIKPNYVYIILMLCWIYLFQYLLAVLCLIMYITAQFFYRPVVFYFNNNEVIHQSWNIKNYPWIDFSNIILKDNILTLDFKNNRVLQAEINHSSVSEDYFNNFVKSKI